mmetsp:Transcript_1660/g.3124  ORF Transcript_1660/g.3124 Transcript_1660/m.3124 type:complete len:93 (-) Transcript_1660:1267-1545(-)
MAYNTYGNGTAHYSLRSSAWPLHVWRKRAREKPKLIVFVISKKRLRLASPVLSRLRLQRSDIDLPAETNVTDMYVTDMYAIKIGHPRQRTCK